MSALSLSAGLGGPLLGLLLAAAPASASDAPASGDTEAPRWSFGGEGSLYILPDDTGYVVGRAHVNRGPLALEARYNYEQLHAASVFLGWNFGFGEKLRLELTPMVGGVFGGMSGVAPGLELDLSFWKLALSSESEYVFDLVEPSASFFYEWSELSLWPVEWARAGFAVQRTRVVQTRIQFQRGFLIGLAYRHLSVAAYWFNPGSEDAYGVFTLGVEL
ncbi:hypothetical protein [Vitiosangium sp. GDMCC 1.1324]|uniref:hypothetical protein n=1 Tax=Vitiosangium sp. (strain GDMCC 1.1324) TaxID=2138576 RepID=UPI000D34CD37|nr:hypothetical protein [Vitiosangium sp. GDMCC 1.1324]PTL85712.1 hypothetical protein DAT35_03125 [Vitiosangium sp. GDMCC 1.1324]